MTERKKRKHGTSAFPPTENKPKGVEAKLALRRRALTWLGGASEARVFEAFAGSGHMWREVWRNAADYVGCDIRHIHDPLRPLYIAPSERVLRAVDLAPFNVFDLDAYGAPWLQAWIVAKRRPLAPGEKLAMIFTDGAALNAHFGSLDKLFRVLSGAQSNDTAAGNWGKLTGAAISRLATEMGAELAWSEVRAATNMACYAAAGFVGRGVAGARVGASAPLG